MIELPKLGVMMRDFRNTADRNFQLLQDEIAAAQQRINREIIDGSSIEEVVDARGGEDVLSDRLRKTDQRLEQARFKDRPIGLNDLSSQTISAIEGGAETSFELLSIPKDKSVTPQKATFTTMNSNLFNHETVTEDIIIRSDGAEEASGSYTTSDFISVEGSQEYTTHGFLYIAVYDADKNFIRRDGTGWNAAEEPSYTTNFETNGFVRLMFQGRTYDYERRMNKGSELQPFEYQKVTLEGVEVPNDLVSGFDETVDQKITEALNPITETLIPSDRIMFDVPIDGVFSTQEVYGDNYPFRNITAAEMHTYYDDLMAQYPNYITKETLGDDSVGNPIHLFRFTPNKPSSTLETKTPKIFLTLGTHGYEHAPPMLIYFMIKDMCEKWQAYPLLEALRFNVEFLVIPVVNPSGWNDYIRQNVNGVDINRNFPEGWVQGTEGDTTYGGPEPLSELEAQYIKQVFDDHPDIDIMYDFHNFSGSSDTEYFIWIPAAQGAYVQHMAQTLISRMTRKWRAEYSFIPSEEDYFVGYTDAIGGGTIDRYSVSRGVPISSLFEVAGRWWLEPDAGLFNNTMTVTGVEAIVNFLLICLKELEKQK